MSLLGAPWTLQASVKCSSSSYQNVHPSLCITCHLNCECLGLCDSLFNSSLSPGFLWAQGIQDSYPPGCNPTFQGECVLLCPLYRGPPGEWMPWPQDWAWLHRGPPLLPAPPAMASHHLVTLTPSSQLISSPWATSALSLCSPAKAFWGQPYPLRGLSSLYVLLYTSALFQRASPSPLLQIKKKGSPLTKAADLVPSHGVQLQGAEHRIAFRTPWNL